MISVRRHLLLALGLALVGAACSPAPVVGDAGPDASDAGIDAGVDAGTEAGTDAGVDAGTDAGIDAGIDAGTEAVIDAGIDAGTDIGGACKQDSDCASGHCDLQPPGGYCTEGCKLNGDCENGTVCEQFVLGRPICSNLCMKDSDCRSGYVCEPIGDVCVPGTTGCKTDTDCPGDSQCDVSSGFCAGGASPLNTVGGKCKQDTDCTVGPSPFCVAQSNFVGGYCSSFCKTDADCGGNPCVPGLLTDGSSICMEGCQTSSDCRADYNCIQYMSKSFCINNCMSNSDCGPEEVCNMTTGQCDRTDGGVPDSGTSSNACSIPDAGTVDAGTDTDAGMDGGSDAGPGDAGVVDAGMPDNDAGFPAAFPMPPQVVFKGGPILKTAKFVPIFFSNDDMNEVTQIEQFDAQVGASDYWAAIGKEYGVGAATSTTPVMLSDIATGTIDDSSIGPFLTGKIASGELPKPDANTLYLLHYPKSMVITLQGSPSCTTFGGYHSNFELSAGTNVAYAVLPRCQPFMGMGTELDIETGTESHEMFEAATDPYPNGHPAWSGVDGHDQEWATALGGGELGDMCAQNPGAFTTFPGLPFVVQRMWSNASVAAGHDPCIPELPNEVYFAAAPELDDLVRVAFPMGLPTTVRGVSVPGCTAKTIALDLYSDGLTDGPFSVQVFDAGPLSGPGNTLSYSLDRTTGWNGDKLNLTIQPLAPAPGSADLFFVVATHGQQQSFWIGVAEQ